MNTAAAVIQYTAAEGDTAAEVTGQVSDYLGRVARALSAASSAVDSLEARLVPVLSTVPEDGAIRAEVAAVRQLAPLAAALAEVEAQVDSIYRRVNTITERCEL